MARDFEENVLILWKYIPKYLGVKCHVLCNLTLKMVQGKRRFPKERDGERGSNNSGKMLRIRD